MRKDENGNTCPETLGEYREYCVAFFGEDSKATKFIDGLIDRKNGSPKDKVLVTDREMRQVLYDLTDTIIIPVNDAAKTNFTVTEKAMRPASTKRECFYCQQSIGEDHKSDCVLIIKKVKIKMTVEYNVNVPAFWDVTLIEGRRKLSSWCADNAIDELKIIAKENGCLCGIAEFTMIEDSDFIFLKEDQ